MNDEFPTAADFIKAVAADQDGYDRFDYVADYLPSFGRVVRQKFAHDVVSAAGDMSAFDSTADRVGAVLTLMVGLHNNLGPEPARERAVSAARAAFVRWGESQDRIDKLIQGFETPPGGRIVFEEMPDER